MVSSTAVLFYFIGSFVPYKAKASRDRTAAEVSLRNHARRVKGVLFCFITTRECAKFCSYLISDKGKAV